jgi:cytochrome c-type biogenesis protein CcmE
VAAPSHRNRMDRRRAELHGWIADTQRLQRQMTVIFGVLAVIALAVGKLALVLVALVATISFWVTASHNAAHRQKLEELDRT